MHGLSWLQRHDTDFHMACNRKVLELLSATIRSFSTTIIAVQDLHVSKASDPSVVETFVPRKWLQVHGWWLHMQYLKHSTPKP